MEDIQNHRADGWIYVKTFADPGYTGFTWDRPGLIGMLSAARSGEIDMVLFYKRERFFRNADLAAQAQGILESCNVGLFSHTEGLAENTPHGVIMRQIQDAMAQFERAGGRVRLMDCLRSSAKRGNWKGGFPPLGYALDSPNRTLVIVESEAIVVRYIFQRVAEGVPLSVLVPELRRLGFYGRPLKKLRGGGGDIVGVRHIFLTSSSIRRIIETPTYRGVVRVVAGPLERKGRSKAAQWEEFKGKHPALVSEEVWFQANRVIKAPNPARIHRVNPGQRGFVGLVQGILVCGCCRCSMSPGRTTKVKRSGEPHRYYRCTRLVKGGKESGCTTRQISCDAMDAAVLSVFRALEANPANFVRAGVGDSSSSRKQMIATVKSELNLIEEKIQENRAAVRNLLEFISKSGTTAIVPDALSAADQSKVDLARLEGERLALLTRLNKLEAQLPSISDLSQACGLFCRSLVLADFKNKACLLRAIIVHVTLSRVQLILPGRSSRKSPRAFRMAVEIDTNALMMFGKTEAQRLLMHNGYGALELKVSFEITASKNEQRVFLLEHAYSTVSARYDTPAPSGEVVVKPMNENPIQRALRWKQSLGEDGQAKRLAIEEGVTPGLVSQLLSLLSLPQMIVDFLKDGRDSELKKKISMRELQRLRGQTTAQAIAWFRRRVSGQPIQEDLNLG